MAQDIVGSKMPANNGYGQNGFQGASSDSPGSVRTNSKMGAELFPADVNSAYAKAGLSQRGPGRARRSTAERGAPKHTQLPAPQTREVDASPLPPAFGHRPEDTSRSMPPAKVPAKLGTSASEPVRKPS
jgi:hypothetical protein